MSNDGSSEPTPKGERSRWLTDVLLIAKVVAIIYVVFIGFGLVLGLSLNGIISTLQRVTYFAVVYALVVLALNLHWGYTGLFNIGVAGFMAVGVYTMAMLTAPVDGIPPGLGLPLWVGIVGGTVATALVGFVVALPALRLRADYFAIVTLGFSEIIRLTYLSRAVREFDLGGWELGPIAVPSVTLGSGGGSGIQFANTDVVITYLLFTDGDRRAGPTVIGELLFGLGEQFAVESSVIESMLYTLFLIGFVGLFYLLLSRVVYSPFGRVLKAIREDEIATRSLGKNTSLIKIKAFMLGCALMGLAGILWQGSRGYVTPEQFMPILTFYIFVALIIGGAGSNTGALIGAFVFSAALWEGPPFVHRIVRVHVDLRAPSTIYDAFVALFQLDVVPMLGYFAGNIDQLRFMLVGIVLILLMLWRPDGMLGYRTELASATDITERPRPIAGDGRGGDGDE